MDEQGLDDNNGGGNAAAARKYLAKVTPKDRVKQASCMNCCGMKRFSRSFCVCLPCSSIPSQISIINLFTRNVVSIGYACDWAMQLVPG